MKITIPAGSIIVMPNGNVSHIPMTNIKPITVDSDNLEVYFSWQDYAEGITIGSVKLIDTIGAYKIAMAIINRDREYLRRYGLQDKLDIATPKM